MVLIPVLCPHCHSDQIIKGGKTKAGKQRYKCQNADCPHYSFQLDLIYQGRRPEIKEQIVDMALNGSGIRDTARVLKISPTTVIVEVVIRLADEAEVDEQWAFVGKKHEQRWLWHAIDHRSGKVLAYVFGRRKDEVFLKLKALLEPFGITRYYTDYWGAYTRHLDAEEHQPGKRHTQKIERKHLTFRTRTSDWRAKRSVFPGRSRCMTL